jgi:hypothetical protein
MEIMAEELAVPDNVGYRLMREATINKLSKSMLFIGREFLVKSGIKFGAVDA